MPTAYRVINGEYQPVQLKLIKKNKNGSWLAEDGITCWASDAKYYRWLQNQKYLTQEGIPPKAGIHPNTALFYPIKTPKGRILYSDIHVAEYIGCCRATITQRRLKYPEVLKECLIAGKPFPRTNKRGRKTKSGD